MFFDTQGRSFARIMESKIRRYMNAKGAISMFASLLFRLLDPVVDAVLSELPDEAASVGRRV